MAFVGYAVRQHLTILGFHTGSTCTIIGCFVCNTVGGPYTKVPANSDGLLLKQPSPKL